MGLVSLILPVYNGEAYLKEAIEAILKQSFQNFELIIVDDCSTDSSPEIIAMYALVDDRIVSVRNSINQRLPETLNIGHRLAKGSYITWTSDDNIVLPTYLEVLVHALESKQCDLVYSSFISVDKELKKIRSVKSKEPGLLIFGSAVGASFLYRKKVFTALNGYDVDKYLVEDYDFWLRASLKFKLCPVSDEVYKYRYHDASLTSKIANDKLVHSKYFKALNATYKLLGDELDFDTHTHKFLINLHLNNKSACLTLLNNSSLLLDDLLKYSVRTGTNFKIVKKELYERIKGIYLSHPSLQNKRNLAKIILKVPGLILPMEPHKWKYSKRIFIKSLFQ
ncbi:MAG: glycosyltransferase family A protein [Nonlabens sp.]